MENLHLEQYGLNHNEAKVYLTLLPLGAVPASVLGRRLNIPRSTAKYTCEQLVKKTLVHPSNKNNTIFYTAKDPKNLQNLIEIEKDRISQKEHDLNKVVRELESLFHHSEELPKVSYYEGTENVIKMFDDVLIDAKPLFSALYIGEKVDPKILEYVNNIYIPERHRLGFQAHSLFNDNERTKNYQAKDGEMHRTSLLVPEKDFPFEICFHIYGGKVAFYSSSPSVTMGIIIQDERIRKMQFSLFKMAWNFARNLPANKKYKNIEL